MILEMMGRGTEHRFSCKMYRFLKGLYVTVYSGAFYSSFSSGCSAAYVMMDTSDFTIPFSLGCL
jgi:hypothetical protein